MKWLPAEPSNPLQMTFQSLSYLLSINRVPYSNLKQIRQFIDPFYPNISVHILHTVLYTCPKVLTERVSLIIKSFGLVGDHFLYSRDLDV